MKLFGLNIFYSEISTEITYCTHSNKDQNESKYLLSSSPKLSSSPVKLFQNLPTDLAEEVV